MKDLSYMYSTHSFRKSIIEGKRVDICSTMVVTPSGQYTENEWIKLIEIQAKEKLELDILDKLNKYALDELGWINTEREAYEYTLNLYSSRIWENKEWLGYEKFNKLLSKEEIIEQISLI